MHQRILNSKDVKGCWVKPSLCLVLSEGLSLWETAFLGDIMSLGQSGGGSRGYANRLDT